MTLSLEKTGAQKPLSAAERRRQQTQSVRVDWVSCLGVNYISQGTLKAHFLAFIFSRGILTTSPIHRPL